MIFGLGMISSGFDYRAASFSGFHLFIDIRHLFSVI